MTSALKNVDTGIWKHWL